MTVAQKGILTLIKSGLSGQALPLPEGFSLEAAFDTVRAHQVVGLCYEGAVLCGIDKKLPVMQQMFALSYKLLLRNEKQMRAMKTLFDRFEQLQIDYLPVKGTVLKDLYPRPELRVMGDADVLIRKERYADIAACMEQLGYTNPENTENVHVWTGKDLMLELHESLVPPDEQEYGYYADLWNWAESWGGHRYGLSREEEYLFTFVHYVKHYRHGGIGLRQLTDLWLCPRKWEGLDLAAVEGKLDTLGLRNFHDNTRTMLESWFADGEESPVSEFMTEYIFASGSWGTAQQAAAAAALHKTRQEGSAQKARMKLLLSSLFPGLEWMRRRYKVLEKAPVLLPVMWPVRWADAVLFRRENIKKNQQKLSGSDDESIEDFRKALQMVGLEPEE